MTPPAEWTVAGQSAPEGGGRGVVTGAQRYTPDLTRPGMLRRGDAAPARLRRHAHPLDASAAEALPGVTVVADGDFVGVVAPDRPTALGAPAPPCAPSGTCRRRRPRRRSVRLSQDAPRPRRPARRWGEPPDLRARLARRRARRRRCTRSTRPTPSPTSPMRRWRPRAALAEWDGRPPDGLDRHAAAVRRARRTGDGVRPARRRRCA